MMSHKHLRKPQLRALLLLLIWSNALAPMAFPQTRKQKQTREAIPKPAKRDAASEQQLYPVFRPGPNRQYKIGFIDNTGKLVIGFNRLPRTTVNVGLFHEGRAIIHLEDENSGDSVKGYIDRTGKIVIRPRFDYARDFSEGLAYVETKRFHGFIDYHGKTVINLKHITTEFGTGIEGLGAKDFHEGRAAVGTGRWEDYQLSRDDSNMWEGRWGYIDHSGKLVIKPVYKFADNFSEGRAGVVVNKPGYKVEATYGFIDMDGNMVVQPQFIVSRGGPHHFGVGGTTVFHDGLARVKTLDGYYGFVNTKGEFVGPTKLNEATDYSDGFAWAVTKDATTFAVTKVGWLDTSGRWAVVDLTSRLDADRTPLTFSEGLAAIPLKRKDGTYLWGYIDHNGNEVIKPRYQAAGPFEGGIAQVSIKEPWLGAAVEFIDRKGRYVWRSK